MCPALGEGGRCPLLCAPRAVGRGKGPGRSLCSTRACRAGGSQTSTQTLAAACSTSRTRSPAGVKGQDQLRAWGGEMEALWAGRQRGASGSPGQHPRLGSLRTVP